MARRSKASRRPAPKKRKAAPKPARARRRRNAGQPRGSERIGRLAREQTVPADATALLAQDHREAESLFDQFEQTEDADQRQHLARRICFALTVHTTVEEDI